MQKVFTTWNGGKKLISEERIVPRHCAYGVIVENNNILLISLKTSDKLWFPGGVVEEGETSEQAVRREIKEETGIDAEVGELLTEIESYFYYDPLDMAWQQFSRFYLCKASSIDLVEFVNPDTSDEAGKPMWVALDVLKEAQMQDYGFEVIKLIRTK
jgi:mutator protein MutT